MTVMCKIPKVCIINSPVSALPFERQIDTIIEWAKYKVGKFVCVANVHMLMEAYWDKSFHSVLRDADLVTPDGMPLVWVIRALGFKNQNRVAGLDILLAVCQRAEASSQSVFFVGSTEETLRGIRSRLAKDFPKLHVAGMVSPPFRPMTSMENQELIDTINGSGANLVFVAFGCPKQEMWMAQNRTQVNAVMIGLGAAFSLYAGVYRRAPLWVRQAGLEWLYRLCQEPKRLWKRYGMTIPPFLILALRQVVLHLSKNV
ncbi:MAG: WecB/TagA/CpsF family glycosyltransferase [Cyanobacteria bacterium P01_F01_bin.150]